MKGWFDQEGSDIYILPDQQSCVVQSPDARCTPDHHDRTAGEE